MKRLFRLLNDERGMTIPEYAIITCIITLATIAAVVALDVKFLVLFVS